MFKVQFKRIFAILQLLAIERLQCRTIKMVTYRGRFISNLVAPATHTKPKISIILTRQLFVPAAHFLDDRFFEQQVHGCYTTCIFSYASIAAFEFVTDASCPRIISVPSFDTAANASHFGLG